MDVEDLLRQKKAQNGECLAELTYELPIIFVFLRHLGCTFCRETLYDLARQRQNIQLEGSAIVLVHMSPPREAEEIFRKYGLTDILHVSDPDQSLYRGFHLNRGPWFRLFGLKVWVRGIIAGWWNGHGMPRKMGDVAQMPGVFLVHRGQIVLEYRHKSPADRPDYVSIATYPFQMGNIPAPEGVELYANRSRPN